MVSSVTGGVQETTILKYQTNFKMKNKFEETPNPIEIFFNGVEGMDGLSVETEGDLSTGISCYFFRVPSLCPLVLPNFQKAWGSRRIKTVCPCQCPEGR